MDSDKYGVFKARYKLLDHDGSVESDDNTKQFMRSTGHLPYEDKEEHALMVIASELNINFDLDNEVEPEDIIQIEEVFKVE